MFGKNWSFILSTLVILLYSCASSPKDDLFSDVAFQFGGHVTPILEPVQPEYKPASSRISLSTIQHIESSLGGWEKFKANNRAIQKNMKRLGYDQKQVNKVLRELYSEEVPRNKSRQVTYEIDLVGHSKMSKLDDRLRWDTRITEMKVGTRTIEPNLPVLECSVVMDRYGNAEGFDLSLPALSQSDTRAKVSAEEYDKIVEAIKYVVTIVKRLSETPIRTGDVLFKSEVKDLIEIISREVPELNLLLKLDTFNKLESIVKGSSAFKDKKVILTSINYINTLISKEFGDNLQVLFNGYSLHDCNTFNILYQKYLCILKFESNLIGKVGIKYLILFKSHQDTLGT